MSSFRKAGGRSFALAIVLSFLVSVVVGCGTQNGQTPDAGQNQQVAVYTIADPTGDWGFPSPYGHYSRGPGYVRMSYIFDTLVWKDDKGYQPALADSWEYLEEEQAFLFKLRKGVTWHDGKPFTAGDVSFTFDYVKNHPYQFVDLSVVKKAEIVDEQTIKIFLAKPYAAFLDYVAASLPILPKHVWSGVNNPLEFQEEEALVGTGPFKLVDYNKAQGTYLYEANEAYYQGQPKVKQLKSIKITEEMTANALKQKQANLGQIPPELKAELEKEGFTILVGEHDWVAKLMINHQKEPLSNKDFRKALAYAIDRQAFVDTCLRGHALKGNPGFIPPDSEWCASDVEQYGYNPKKTGEILEDLGYVKKGNYYEKNGQVLELELLISSTGIGVQGAPAEREGEMLQQQLENAGIKIVMRSLDTKTLDNRVKEWKFDLALSGHGGMGGDPELLTKMLIGEGFNSARYKENGKIVNLLKEQQQTMDKEQRKELVFEIQKLCAEELPVIPLYYPTWYWGHDGQVDLFYTWQGIATGVPLPLNKMPLVK